jgi:hypothetical protein
MGNCPTCSPEQAGKSLDPLCNGKRMWTTFLFSSFAVLLGGWVIVVIYEVLKRLFAKWRHDRRPTKMKKVSRSNKIHKTPQSCTLSFLMQVRSRRQGFTDDDAVSDYDFGWLTEIKEYENNIISGQTKIGKTFVSILGKMYTNFSSLLQVTVIFLCSIASLTLYCVDTQHNA